MYIHIALFKWKQNVTTTQINKTLQSIKKLKNKIKGVNYIYCGRNTHKMSKGFTHGAVIIAENKSALTSYRKHVDHIQIAETVIATTKDGLGFDFEDNN